MTDKINKLDEQLQKENAEFDKKREQEKASKAAQPPPELAATQEPPKPEIDPSRKPQENKVVVNVKSLSDLKLEATVKKDVEKKRALAE